MINSPEEYDIDDIDNNVISLQSNHFNQQGNSLLCEEEEEESAQEQARNKMNCNNNNNNNSYTYNIINDIEDGEVKEVYLHPAAAEYLQNVNSNYTSHVMENTQTENDTINKWDPVTRALLRKRSDELNKLAPFISNGTVNPAAAASNNLPNDLLQMWAAQLNQQSGVDRCVPHPEQNSSMEQTNTNDIKMLTWYSPEDCTLDVNMTNNNNNNNSNNNNNNNNNISDSNEEVNQHKRSRDCTYDNTKQESMTDNKNVMLNNKYQTSTNDCTSEFELPAKRSRCDTAFVQFASDNNNNSNNNVVKVTPERSENQAGYLQCQSNNTLNHKVKRLKRCRETDDAALEAERLDMSN